MKKSNKKFLIPVIILFLSVQESFVFSQEDINYLQKARKLHAKIISVDSHTDTPLHLIYQENFNPGEKHSVKDNRSHVDFPRMKEGCLDAVFFAVFLGQGIRNDSAYSSILEKTILIFDKIDDAIRQNNEISGLALTYKDALKNKKKGKVSVFTGIENGYAIGKDTSLIRKFYNRGARYITLCHTKNNDICDSSTDTTEHNGLSEFGISVVKKMNETGMIIDVSHISDSAFYDVLKYSKTPVIASHSCARKLCDNPRNLSDKMLQDLSDNGGVIQMCILSDYVKNIEQDPLRDSLKKEVRKEYNGFQNLSAEKMTEARKAWYSIDSLYPQKYATVSDVADHIDHIIKIAGIDHVGIGTDFDGGGGVDGCMDASELINITVELLKRGYSDADIEKIWGKNLFRVLDEVTGYSLNLKSESPH